MHSTSRISANLVQSVADPHVWNVLRLQQVLLHRVDRSHLYLGILWGHRCDSSANRREPKGDLPLLPCCYYKEISIGMSRQPDEAIM
jgi:hypothetical protein